MGRHKDRISPEVVTEFWAFWGIGIVVDFASILHTAKFSQRISLDIFFAHGGHLSMQKLA